MKLSLKDKKDCKYDVISLGEVMLRLDPGDYKIRKARNFTAWAGGGEYNVTAALSSCFGMDTAVVTSFVENEVGFLIEDFIRQAGVDTKYIKWLENDGIGKSARNGLNFTERGFGVRGAVGVSDRANTAACKLKPGDIDWEKIFGEDGVRWFHTGGIFAALSEETAETILEAVKIAKKYGTLVSYDLNYRPSLWAQRGGTPKARELNRKLAPYIDLLIGTRGFDLEDSGEKKLPLDEHKKLIKKISADFPNIYFITDTLRKIHTANNNDWSAFAYVDGEFYMGKKYDYMDILDRVGGGDGYGAGLIYALMNGYDPEKAINYGLAHGALVMSTPGDTSMAKLKDVEYLALGGSAKVKR